MTGTFAEDFAGARPVAQHCEELIRRGPRPEERAEILQSWRRDLAQELAQELGQLFSDGKLHVTVAEPEMITGSEVFERIGPVAANSLLRCGGAEQTALLSLDYATAIALTDCSFGGEGTPPEEVPAVLPRSAAMLVEQFAKTIAQVIVMTNGSAEHGRSDVLVRSESVARLKPFSAEAKVACFNLTMTQGALAEWQAILAVAEDRLDSLLPGMNAAGPSSTRRRPPSDATSGPFAAMPMQVEAVLGAFEMSIERLENLAPGDEIPLSIAAELPLMLGEQVLAHGVVGTLENQMALRLTRLAGSARASAPNPVSPDPSNSIQGAAA